MSVFVDFLTNQVDGPAQEKKPELFKPNTTCDLWCLATNPDYRGLKIANKLIQLAMNRVKEAGYPKIQKTAFK